MAKISHFVTPVLNNFSTAIGLIAKDLRPLGPAIDDAKTITRRRVTMWTWHEAKRVPSTLANVNKEA